MNTTTKYYCKLYNDDSEFRCALSMYNCPIDKYDMFNDKHEHIIRRRICNSGMLEINWTEYIRLKSILEEYFEC